VRFSTENCWKQKKIDPRLFLLIIINRQPYTLFQMRWQSSTLDDLEGQYCNRNCIGFSASFLDTAALICSGLSYGYIFSFVVNEMFYLLSIRSSERRHEALHEMAVFAAYK